MVKNYNIKDMSKQGYSNAMIEAWSKRVNKDLSKHKNMNLKNIHSRGYLASSIKKYDLLNKKDDRYITDFDYIFLRPYNNGFRIWLQDINTTNKILRKHKQFCREIYFSIVKRNAKNLILKYDELNKVEYTIDDVVDLLKEKKKIELRPTVWFSKSKRYLLEYKHNNIYLNNKLFSEEKIAHLIKMLNASYIISEPIDYSHDDKTNYYVNFYIANDYNNDETVILDSYAYVWIGNKYSNRKMVPIDDLSGEFNYKGTLLKIENYDSIKENIKEIASSVKQLDYFLISIAIKDEGFVIVYFSTKPYLPYVAISDKFNDYLNLKADRKRNRLGINNKSVKKLKEIEDDSDYDSIKDVIEKRTRPGMRNYMQSLWVDLVKKDFINTNKSIEDKRWAWQRGFLSYRIDEYKLTEDNYESFISDYDYMWLNRINNRYQIWVNDKTTFRMVLDPFKEYLPKYFYSIFKREGKVRLLKMDDCPNHYSDDIDGLIDLLKTEGKLALKASAGTHGDGFYCLSYHDEKFHVNEKEVEVDYIYELIENLDSFYIVTEYIEVHPFIKKLNSKSVNTIRINIVNNNGFDPIIVQNYIRIGTANTGFIDNVLYGGICANIDTNTGEIYEPEIIKNNIYTQCYSHPDTGVKIEGKIPNWEFVKEKIIEICQYYPELEYLGFDIAITNDGFKITEINIHPDLINVLHHSDELKEFLFRKLRAKRIKYFTLERLNKI